MIWPQTALLSAGVVLVLNYLPVFARWLWHLGEEA